MGRTSKLARQALGGYLAVTLLLAGGMAVAIHRQGAIATEQILMIRRMEDVITRVERLRWHSEQMISGARAHLLTGDEGLLVGFERARAAFEQDILSVAQSPNDPVTSHFLVQIQQSATDYGRVLEAFVANGKPPGGDAVLVRQFELELLPARQKLGKTIDLLVEFKEDTSKARYAEAARARRSLELGMYGLLGLLALVGLGIAWTFSTLLGRAFTRESEALDAAQNALSARDELMGMVAHDLRNPLSAIMIGAGLLHRAEMPPPVRKHAESIGNLATRMESLIRSMLDAATMRAGKFTVKPHDCDAQDLLAETVSSFEHISSAKQIRLRSQVSGTPRHVWADRERALQVLSNLVGNALKFTPEGGEITLLAMEEGAQVRFSVTDTGPGILEAHLPRLFDRYWKHEAGGKKGTGLGLYISRGIVEAHGGTIWAESLPGQGATFFFTLPVAAEQPSIAKPA